MSTNLPREIIKWIQSLDLSFAIKNYKRDFANGFLLAEILSKYYPADVQMHAFDTGTGTGAKKNNWGMLERIFTKYSIPVSKEICTNVAACNPKSANILLSIIYWHLNNKAPPPEGITATSATLMPQQQRSSSNNHSSSGLSKGVHSGNGSGDQQMPGEGRNAPSTAEHILSAGRDSCILVENTLEPFASSEGAGNGSGTGSGNANGGSGASIGGIIHGTVRTAQLVLGSDLEYESPAEDQLSIGRVSCMRTICQIFGVTDQQVNFHRNGFPTNMVRDILTYKIETGQRYETDVLMSLLNDKVPELMAIIQQSPPVDFQLVFDTIIPCIVNYGSSTKSLFAAMAAMSTILYMLGDLCQRMLPTGESYRRLSSARDYVAMIQQLSLPTMDKIPFIARIIHAFLGPDILETERVRVFLEIKSVLNKERMQSPLIQSKSASGSEFIFFLASFNAIDDYPLHSAMFQFTVFHLSECLTIINAYKGAGQGSALLLSSMNVPSIASDISANPGITILSTADLPSLEVSAALHILAAIVRAGVPLEHQIMTDIVDSALRTFLKTVINPQCASHLQKAYMGVVVALLETLPIDQPRDSIEYILLKELLSITNNLLKWFAGEPLRAALILTAPVLFRHQRLCTPFVRGLVSVGDTMRVELLRLPVDKRSKQVLAWDLPFLLDLPKPYIFDIWWGFGVGMGICKSIEYSRSPLEGPYLQILWAVARDRGQTENKSADPIDKHLVPQNAWNHMFLCLSDHIIASLAVHELSDLAWSVFSGFMQICSRDTILKKFPALLGVLVYVHTADRGRCRRRILGRLKRWATKDPLKAKPSASNPLDATGSATPPKWPPDPNDAHAIHLEAKRVLRIFTTEFPTLSGAGTRSFLST
ncbi:hypothetical protein BC831DRAFT_401125 [Entophlyctis helioformis]|nr:hypothetical protein BC831DRAFT_401125 [Entophlyctis helioformis]